MRRLVVLLALASGACVESPIAGRQQLTLPPAPPVGDSCVSALLLVDKDVATAAAVDPVETQMGLLHSRRFAEGASPDMSPFGLVSTERLGHSGLFKLRIVAEPKRAQAICEWSVKRALAEGRTFSQSGRAWLVDRRAELEHEIADNQRQLKAFDELHALLSIPLDDQVEMLQNEVKALQAARVRGQRGLDAPLRARSDELIRLVVLHEERRRIAGAADSTRAILKVVDERLGTQEVSDMLAPSLRTVDGCAPCEAPKRAR